MRSPVELPSAVERGADLLGQVDYRLAETTEELEEIYRLRYRAYLREQPKVLRETSARAIPTALRGNN